MSLISTRPLARMAGSRLALAAFTAVVALAAGCDVPGTSLLHPGDGGGGSGDTGTSSSDGGGGSTSTTSTSTTSGTTSTSTSGTTTSTSTETPQPATFTVSLDDTTPTVDLAAKVQVTVSIAPNGYSGPVSLTVDDLSGSGVKAELGSPTVMLDGASTATTKLTLTTVSSSMPGDLGFKVTGTVPTGDKLASATLTVVSAITLVIPQGVNAMAGPSQDDPYKLAFGDFPTKITAPSGISSQKPVIVRFYNDDDVKHQIHADSNAQGFSHDPLPIQPNSMDDFVREVNAKGTFDFYLHDQGQPLTVGRIVIQ
jgi:hypothetical protein